MPGQFGFKIVNATITGGTARFVLTPSTYTRTAMIGLRSAAVGTSFTVTDTNGGGGTAEIAKGVTLNLQISGQGDATEGAAFDLSALAFGGTNGDVLFCLYEARL